MKLVIQRVKLANVKVTDKSVGKIGVGLLILIGVSKNDTQERAELLAEKVSKLRIMADENDKMNLSVKDIDASVLVVSQFTLYADTSAGNRPSFIKAGDPQMAREIYKHFINKLKQLGIKTAAGEFGEYMKIDAKLDGPVTILIDEE